jgi:hypothetical protein
MHCSINPFHALLNRELFDVFAQIAATLAYELKAFPFLRTLQAILASLLASAVASLLRCMRDAACFSQAPKLKRSQLCGRIRITFAA